MATKTKITPKATVKLVTEFPLKEELPVWKAYVAERSTGDGISLMVTDGKGNEWYILTLQKNGTFYREPSIPSDIGFKLNERGQIVESKTELF